MSGQGARTVPLETEPAVLESVVLLFQRDRAETAGVSQRRQKVGWDLESGQDLDTGMEQRQQGWLVFSSPVGHQNPQTLYRPEDA